MKNKKRKRNKGKKFNWKRFLIFILFLFLLSFSIYKLVNTNIKNIYVKGNYYFSDQEIIDMAGIKNYPNSLKNISHIIKSRIEKNKYILSSKVYKTNFFSKVYIEVEENYPLFYYQTESKTVLYNGDKVSDNFTSLNVINQIPSVVYKEFIEKIRLVNIDVLNRMSEIEYKPNDVDEERFLVLMNDGNYAYLTLNKFLRINKYLDIVKSFNEQKGILYLDSGEYFDIFDK